MKNLSTDAVQNLVDNRRATPQEPASKPLHGVLANQRSWKIGRFGQVAMLVALACFAGAVLIEILRAGGSI